MAATCRDCEVELTEENTYQHKSARNTCKRCHCKAVNEYDHVLNELTREGAVKTHQPWEQWEIDLLVDAMKEGVPAVETAGLLRRSMYAVSNRAYLIHRGEGLVAVEQPGGRSLRVDPRHRSPGPARPVVVCGECFCAKPCFCD